MQAHWQTRKSRRAQRFPGTACIKVKFIAPPTISATPYNPPRRDRINQPRKLSALAFCALRF